MTNQNKIRDSITVAKVHATKASPSNLSFDSADPRQRRLVAELSPDPPGGPSQSQNAASMVIDSQTTSASSRPNSRQAEVCGHGDLPKKFLHAPLPLTVQAVNSDSEVTVGTDAQGWPVFVVSEKNIHDGSKIVGGPIREVRMRHFLMVMHCGISVIVTVLTSIILKDKMILCLLTGLLIAVSIYIPTAAGLTFSRRRNHFDHAAGEVSYLGLQSAGWLMVSILNIQYITYTPCDMRRRVYLDGGYKWIQPYTTRCQWSTGLLGLSFVHLLLLLGWMIWIIVVVHKASPGYPNKGFQVSTGWLMRGWKV